MFARTLFKLCLIISSTLPGAAETIVFGSNDHIHSRNGRYYNAVYTQAFKKLGIDFEYQFLPAKRSTTMAIDGRIDGEVARIREYGIAHPSLIRVDAVTLIDSFSAFSVDPSLHLNGWKSLNDATLKIDYLRGVYRVEQALSKGFFSGSVYAVDSVRNALRRLVHQRSDIYVDSESSVLGYLVEQEFEGSGISIVGQMESTEYYAYFNDKHKELALSLAGVLTKMRDDGELERILNAVLAEN